MTNFSNIRKIFIAIVTFLGLFFGYKVVTEPTENVIVKQNLVDTLSLNDTPILKVDTLNIDSINAE